MTSRSYRVVRWSDSYERGSFDCGEPAYNEWLAVHASSAVSARSSMVYLMLEADGSRSERVVGYYAICPTMIVRDDAPKGVQRNLLRNAPGWLITKLALDVSLRGDRTQQWGRHLLRDALERIVESADRGGGQVIVVDADNAGLVTWYEQNGFQPSRSESLRLYMKVSSARKYLA